MRHLIKLRRQQAWLPDSARMGCALSPERLQTEPCLKHKAPLTGQKEREQRRVSLQSLRAVIQYTTGLQGALFVGVLT